MSDDREEAGKSIFATDHNTSFDITFFDAYFDDHRSTFSHITDDLPNS